MMRVFGVTIVTLLLAGMFFINSTNAMAQAGVCGDAPPLANVQLKGEIDFGVGLLSRYVGDIKFKGQVEFQKNEVLSRYPNADKIVIKLTMMYQVCMLIMYDNRITTEKRLSLLQEARDAIFSPSSERTIEPNSFIILINGFRVDRHSELEGILNFTIENRSGANVGIGILDDSATAGGCSGRTNINGVPSVAPAGTYAAQTGVIFWEALKRAPDPAQKLKWLPAGGRLSATIGWYNCSAEMPTAPATVPIVLAIGRDVLELSLTSNLQ